MPEPVSLPELFDKLRKEARTKSAFGRLALGGDILPTQINLDRAAFEAARGIAFEMDAVWTALDLVAERITALESGHS